MNKKLRVFEAFAGYGSQSIALRNLNIPYEVVAISEIDKYAIQAYEAIHGKVNNLGDISKIKVEDIPEHDLFTYSFPCQSISTAGLKLGLNDKTKSGLLYECEKIIEYRKPKYLLMENVKNLLSKKHMNDFNNWLKYLESLGYKSYYKILDSKDFGVPQSRKRVFVVSILGEHKTYEFPCPKNIDTSLSDVLCDDVDEKLFNIKPSVKKNIDKLKEYILNCEKDIFVPTQNQVSSGRQDNLVGINISPCCRQNGYTLVLDNGNIRRLSTNEYFKLMGLCDNDIYKIQQSGISDTQQYKMAGNSIVVQVLEEIFTNLFL